MFWIIDLNLLIVEKFLHFLIFAIGKVKTGLSWIIQNKQKDEKINERKRRL